MRISDWSSDVCSSDLRDFANAAALVKSHLGPPELLRKLKKIERKFGRRSVRRWGPRVLDLDIILWSGGAWPSRLRWSAGASPERATCFRPEIENTGKMRRTDFRLRRNDRLITVERS